MCVACYLVITDGGWSKRTHKHSYNAAGGVAIIIGKETKKPLHIGVRNKFVIYVTIKVASHTHVLRTGTKIANQWKVISF
jgi:hypothetical protein